MNKGFLFCLILLVSLFGCGKKLSGIFHRDHNHIKINEIDFDYFTGKLKIDFDGEKRLSGVANLRMRKDSIIWISLSPGLGVEVARILISKHSIEVLDKFNKKYIVTDFEKLTKKFGFDINYSLIESIFLGNLVTPYAAEKLTRVENAFQYEQQIGNYHIINSIGTKTMKLEKFQVQDSVSKSSVLVTYEGFQLVEDQILPFNIAAKLFKEPSNVASTRLDLEYSKAEIAKKPLKFPFNVPQKYTRDEIN